MTSPDPEHTFQGKLVDFDWQVRHVLGSSTSRNLGESLTQVSFIVKSKNENDPQVRNITVEFTKAELKQFITTLERSLQD